MNYPAASSGVSSPTLIKSFAASGGELNPQRFKHSVLGDGWQRHKVATVRWRLFHLPGKVVRHAGALVLKIATEFVGLFRDIRSKSFQLSKTFSP